jgi:hypothetical protein
MENLMAIYHARVKTFSRAKNYSSTAAAAYRAGLRIKDSRTGITYDYRRRSGVVETRIVAPQHAPLWVNNPKQLWDEAEKAERRCNATVAREFEIALPHELDSLQRSKLTSAIARALVERYGFVIQASIHSPPGRDGLNHHAHLLATTRRVDMDGMAEKTRELDGGISGRHEVEWVRAMVARITNDALKAASIEIRVDHRSLEEQSEAALEKGDLMGAVALSRSPTLHLGKDVTAMMRRGMDCERADENQQIVEANAAMVKATLAELGEAVHSMPDRGDPTSEGAPQEVESEHEEQDVAAAAIDTQAIEHSLLLPVSKPDPAIKAQIRESRMAATRQEMAEAVQIWGEGFYKKIDRSFECTIKLLRFQFGRFEEFVQDRWFQSDVRSLLQLLKQFQHDAMRFQRRLKAHDQAQRELWSAEGQMENFDFLHPHPGKLSRAEWMAKRARRVSSLRKCEKAQREAYEATNPDAQTRYHSIARKSGEAVENLSWWMLKHYVVSWDRQPDEDASSAPAQEPSNRPEPPLRPGQNQ